MSGSISIVQLGPRLPCIRHIGNPEYPAVLRILYRLATCPTIVSDIIASSYLYHCQPRSPSAVRPSDTRTRPITANRVLDFPPRVPFPRPDSSRWSSPTHRYDAEVPYGRLSFWFYRGWAEPELRGRKYRYTERLAYTATVSN